MRIRDLIDDLIKMEVLTSKDAEVEIHMTNIPGIGEVHGGLIDRLSAADDVGADTVTIEVIAP